MTIASFSAAWISYCILGFTLKRLADENVAETKSLRRNRYLGSIEGTCMNVNKSG